MKKRPRQNINGTKASGEEALETTQVSEAKRQMGDSSYGDGVGAARGQTRQARSTAAPSPNPRRTRGKAREYRPQSEANWTIYKPQGQEASAPAGRTKTFSVSAFSRRLIGQERARILGRKSTHPQAGSIDPLEQEALRWRGK